MTMNPGTPVQNLAPHISISIVSHGNAAEVRTLLGSISRQEQASHLQLILTENLGNDLPDVERSGWHSLTVLRNQHPRGFASNHNAAFKHARGEFFCLLNPDVLLLEPVFDRLIDHIRAGRGDVVAPLAIDGRGQVQDSFRPLPTPLELFRRRALGKTEVAFPDPVQPVTPDWIAGFFQLMPARLYGELRGMDERFRLYLEDVEFCTRARLAGYRMLVDPALRFRHDGQRASKRQLRFFLWHLGSAMRFFTSPVYRRARYMNPRS